MNTDNNEQNDTESGGIRPLGYWLRTVDALISREFAAAFEGEGVTRRDWMLLNVVSGDVTAPGFAEQFARRGKRLRGLEQRGWVEEAGDGTWILTDDGRAAKERLGTVVDGIRSRVTGALSPDDYATTMASLEAIARELGWDETADVPWPERGFGRRFGRGFGPRFGPDDAAFTAPEYGRGWHGGCDHGEHRGHGGHGHGGHDHGHAHGHAHGGHDHGHGSHGHGHGHGRRHGRDGERAYERGFDAGFRRGQEAS